MIDTDYEGFDTGSEERGTGLDRTLGTAPWFVPPDIGLNATGELLVWRWGAPAERRQSPGRGLLDDFVRLADAAPERILVQLGREKPVV